MDNKGLKIKVTSNTPSPKALMSFQKKLYEMQQKNSALSCQTIKKT